MEVACAAIDFFVVPTTAVPEQKGEFTLSVYSTCVLEVVQSAHPHLWNHRSISGEWDDQRDGGSRIDNPTTWIHNPCYELTVEPTPDNRTVDVHFMLERGTLWNEATYASFAGDAVGARKYKEKSTEEIGIMITTASGDLPVVDISKAWAKTRTNELWVNELPAGKYYVLPISRRAGHRDTYHLTMMSSEVVGFSFDIPLARRLREKQLQQYAEENEARRKEHTVGAIAGQAFAAQQAIKAAPTGHEASTGLHPYDEDYDIAVRLRDQITEAYMTSGALYIDRDFPRAPSSLWMDPEKKPATATANVENWLRPNDVRLSGQNHSSGNVVSEPVFIPGGEVSGVDIQGGFNSDWFHGAVGTIATRPDLLAKVVSAYYPEYGFAQFRFFKNGRWHTVTIDDNLPVDALNDLCFSRSTVPTDVFIPLIEKAWAKLHRCYEALDAGPESIPEALMSLTGGICNVREMQTETGREWVHKQLWRTLGCCREKNQVIALALLKNSLQAEDKQYTGLHLDSLYTVIDSRDVEGKKLLKIRNFWGESKPWKGKWASQSESWTPTLKKAVDYVEERTTFWMGLDEVKYYFSHLYHVNLHGASAWITGGFAANQASGDLQSPTWVNNPQYALKVHTQGPTKVTIGLHQPDARMTMTRVQGATPDYPSQMGVICIRTDDDSRRLMTITTKEVPTSSRVTNQRDTFLEIEVDPSAGHKYIVMPFTVTQNKACTCMVSAWCMEPIPLSLSVIDSDRNVKVDGEWKGPTAGGPRSHGSWRNNPQLLLYPSETTQVTIVLRQRNELNSTAAHIGFTVMKARDIRSVLHPNPADIVLEVPHDNDHAVVGNVHVEGVRERSGMPYVIIPSTSVPHLETGFTLEVISNKRVQLKHVDPEYDWKRVDISGRFDFHEGTTGGSMAFSSWRNNPQYTLNFPTEKSGSLLVVLTKRDPSEKSTELGLTVMKSDPWAKGKMRKVLCPAGDIIATSTSQAEDSSVEIRIDYQVRKEPLILMPFTVAPLCELDYDLSLYCSSDITVAKAADWKNKAVEGHWEPGISAGGSRDQNRSWINNPFYCLSLTRPTRVVIVALQYPRGPEKPIVKRVGKNRAFLPPPIVNEKSKVCFGFDVCHFDAMNTNIHSTRHTYDGEVTAMLELPACDTNPYLIVPHTFDPEQDADFKLLLFADEAFDVYHHEKARRFY